MLRGQASLQELIGRSFMSRKRSGSQGKKQQAPANAAQTPADNAHLQEMPGSDQQQQQQHQQERQQQQQSLQPGQVCCPVCGAAILEKAMNTHLGEIVRPCIVINTNDVHDANYCRCMLGKRDVAT